MEQLPQNTSDSLLKKSIQYTHEIKLSPQNRDFTFGFTTTGFPREENIKYYYRLIGFDNRWLTTNSKNRRLKYTNLDPGEYRFEIYSVSGAGIKSDVNTLSINIFPHFYETLWFKVLLFSLVFLGFFAWYKYRIYQIKKYNHKLEIQVQQRTQDIKTLADIAKDICFLLDIHELLQQIYGHLNRSLDVNALAIGIYEPDKNRIKFDRSLEMGNIMPLHYRPMDPTSHLAAWCIHHNKEIVLNCFDDRFKYLNNNTKQIVGESMQTVVYLPIRSRNNQMLGCITVQSHQTDAYNEVDLEFIRTISNYTGVALDNALVHSELKRISSTDFLTNLLNRRAFLESAQYQIKTIRRTSQVITFAMADLDGFKGFNDKFGHECGDYVLKRASDLFHGSLRGEDLVGRWGGEEFIFMFPNTNTYGAFTALENLRILLCGSEFDYQGITLNISSTFGLCEYRHDIGLDETIHRADTALYHGKKNGRNRVEIYSDKFIDI